MFFSVVASPCVSFPRGLPGLFSKMQGLLFQWQAWHHGACRGELSGSSPVSLTLDCLWTELMWEGGVENHLQMQTVTVSLFFPLKGAAMQNLERIPEPIKEATALFYGMAL